ncbi:hypothetical protein KIW84_057225 [Lathyrus oleraceus]|uniref:Uncharacterized protein n=1 Tax=Pisum sativum TaxID=3888 RepID=A0A9D4X0F2_PEA|nr:hypothetical protein KIW84_057225 [Pisum sativum]
MDKKVPRQVLPANFTPNANSNSSCVSVIRSYIKHAIAASITNLAKASQMQPAIKPAKMELQVRMPIAIKSYISAIGFEGFEKRLEISFSAPGLFSDPQGKGLRSLTKSQLDEILAPAECTIVSSLANEDVDSYVLSESSLFVYAYKFNLKTCSAHDHLTKSCQQNHCNVQTCINMNRSRSNVLTTMDITSNHKHYVKQNLGFDKPSI